jgi:hypothetical protein
MPVSVTLHLIPRRAFSTRLRGICLRHILSKVWNNCGNDSTATDFGIAINDASNGHAKSPAWGEFSQAHVYTANFVGTGAPISLNYHDCISDDNEGTLRLEIFIGG